MTDDKKWEFLHYWHALAPGMPEPVTEYKFAKLGMKRNWALDWAWPDLRIGVEVDGGQFAKFGGRHNSDADREKRNAFAMLSWRVFYFSPQQLQREPQKCVGMVVDLIRFESE